MFLGAVLGLCINFYGRLALSRGVLCDVRSSIPCRALATVCDDIYAGAVEWARLLGNVLQPLKDASRRYRLGEKLRHAQVARREDILVVSMRCDDENGRERVGTVLVAADALQQRYPVKSRRPIDEHHIGSMGTENMPSLFGRIGLDDFAALVTPENTVELQAHIRILLGDKQRNTRKIGDLYIFGHAHPIHVSTLGPDAQLAR